MSLHLGILQTDSVLPQFQREYGDYPHMFGQLFHGANQQVQFSHYDVTQKSPSDVVCDAYVITGSKRSVYEDLGWIKELVAYLKTVLDAGKKIIGVCFGHQLMAHYFGGRVEAADVGWVVGVHTSHVQQQHPWMAGDVSEVALLSSHKDQVTALPPGAEVYLSNEICPIAGFTMGDQVVTVQGHPEFSKGYARDLMEMRQELLGEEIYGSGIASLSEVTQENLFVQWLLAFARGEPGE